MKIVAFVLALILAIPSTLLAQSGDMKSMKGMDGMMGGRSMSKDEKGQMTHKATGVVKSIDAKKGSATLAHGPVHTLKWPSMTMSFAVKDKATLDKLQPGKKVEFEFAQQGKDHVITSVK